MNLETKTANTLKQSRNHKNRLKESSDRENPLIKAIHRQEQPRGYKNPATRTCQFVMTVGLTHPRNIPRGGDLAHRD